MLFRAIVISTLLLFSSLSLLAKENYPLSDFPMYSNPSSNRYLYWLATDQGEALPIKTFTKYSAAQFGKIVRTYIANDQKITIPSDEINKRVGQQVLSYLRQNQKQTLPLKMAIMRTDFSYQDNKIVEKSFIYYSE